MTSSGAWAAPEAAIGRCINKSRRHSCDCLAPAFYSQPFDVRHLASRIKSCPKVKACGDTFPSKEACVRSVRCSPVRRVLGMKAIQSVAKRTCRAAAMLALWANMNGAALAADTAAADKSWTLSWMLVVLSVALGLLVVLRPVGRTTEVKQKSDD